METQMCVHVVIETHSARMAFAIRALSCVGDVRSQSLQFREPQPHVRFFLEVGRMREHVFSHNRLSCHTQHVAQEESKRAETEETTQAASTISQHQRHTQICPSNGVL